MYCWRWYFINWAVLIEICLPEYNSKVIKMSHSLPLLMLTSLLLFLSVNRERFAILNSCLWITSRFPAKSLNSEGPSEKRLSGAELSWSEKNNPAAIKQQSLCLDFKLNWPVTSRNCSYTLWCGAYRCLSLVYCFDMFCSGVVLKFKTTVFILHTIIS